MSIKNIQGFVSLVLNDVIILKYFERHLEQRSARFCTV